MDIYLPADFYALRENLHDWRDASNEPMQSQPRSSTDKHDDCADQDWRVL